MPNDINHKKKAPIICAVVMIVLLAIFLGAIIYPLLGDAHGEIVALGILLVYGLLIFAVIIGILFALRQRLKEIEGGEEDDAKKY